MQALQLPDYSALTLGMIFLYALAGFFGALVRVAWLDKPLRGFYRDKDGGVRMGFFAEIIVAVAVALAIDGHPIRAGIAAIFAPFILDAVRVFITEKIPDFLYFYVRDAIDREDSDDSEENRDG